MARVVGMKVRCPFCGYVQDFAGDGWEERQQLYKSCGKCGELFSRENFLHGALAAVKGAMSAKTDEEKDNAIAHAHLLLESVVFMRE